MCREAGIPANRMLLLCGDVVGGGHCWLAYKPSQNPVELVFMDWCYWFDNRSIETRPKFRIIENNLILESIFNTVKDYRFKNYIKMWWCFNENNTFISFKPTGGK